MIHLQKRLRQAQDLLNQIVEGIIKASRNMILELIFRIAKLEARLGLVEIAHANHEEKTLPLNDFEKLILRASSDESLTVFEIKNNGKGYNLCGFMAFMDMKNLISELPREQREYDCNTKKWTIHGDIQELRSYFSDYGCYFLSVTEVKKIEYHRLSLIHKWVGANQIEIKELISKLSREIKAFSFRSTSSVKTAKSREKFFLNCLLEVANKDFAALTEVELKGLKSAITEYNFNISLADVAMQTMAQSSQIVAWKK
jgi:hypothetical protein